MNLPKIKMPVLNDDGTLRQIDVQADRQARVMIVDDNPAKLTSLAAVVSAMALEVVTVNSGRGALRELLRQDFALILLDVLMPVMDGYETAKIIRSRPRSAHTPIIFITAEAMLDEDRIRGYALGAVDWILSPITPEILQAKIKVFVDLYYLLSLTRQQTTELKALNATLEEKVEERTAALNLEAKERFEAELRYRTLFEVLPVAVVIIDDKARIVEFNDAACRQLGYSREEFAQIKLTDIDNEMTFEKAKAHIKKVLSDGYSEFETHHCTKAGALLDIRVTANPLRLGDNDWIQCVFLDVTQLKQTEKLEAKARANAEQVIRLKRELKSMAQFLPSAPVGETKAPPRLPLKEAKAELFAKLVDEYLDLVKHAVERQIYRVEYDISGNLQTMAEKMTCLQAVPNDVVAVHVNAIKICLNSAKYEPKKAYIDEGRLMVLELMGYLAKCYQRQASIR